MGSGAQMATGPVTVPNDRLGVSGDVSRVLTGSHQMGDPSLFTASHRPGYPLRTSRSQALSAVRAQPSENSLPSPVPVRG